MDKAEMVQAESERSVPLHVLRDIQKKENSGIEFSLEGLGIKQLDHATVTMRHESHVAVQEEVTRMQNKYGNKLWGKNWRSDDTKQTWPAIVAKMIQRDKLLRCVIRFNLKTDEVNFSEYGRGNESEKKGEIELREAMRVAFFPDLPIKEKMTETEINEAYDDSDLFRVCLIFLLQFRKSF